MLKIAPDLGDEELRDIAEAVKATKGVDGIIVSNTTIQRPASLTDRKLLFHSSYPTNPSKSS